MSIACVKISHLPLRCEIARRTDLDAQIIIVYHGEESRPVVLDASPNARLRRGESLVRPMTQHPGAAVIRADETFYDARWHEIIEDLLNVSDRVEDTARGTAFVAIDGLSELYGSQEQTVEQISEATAKHDLDAQIGVAPGRFPAYCAAIRAQPFKPIRLPNSRVAVKEFLAPMAVDFLPLEARSTELLHDFALHTMGDLAAQSISALQAQLGSDGIRAWELVNGIDRTRLNTIERSQKIIDSFQFESPAASMDALSFGIQMLLNRAFASVQSIGKAAGRMDLTCEMSDSGLWDYSHVFKEPTDSATLAHSVVMTRIETVVQTDDSPIRSPVENILVELSHLGQGRAEQSSLWREEKTGDLDTALRQLKAKMGSLATKKIVDVEPWSRIPERRQAWAEVTSR
ncbi:MAG: hypothetical protein F4Y63_07195 [Chloroflexi bacterium]|nr:hypothetical protein [Chloroflexota bacterium]MYF79812.1 hypothetical protein [Chloroflexota bacterium]MYK61441.1 hypothetical protein [Chloroflexota bacterium]